MSTAPVVAELQVLGARQGFPRPPLARAVQRVLEGEGRSACISITFLGAAAMQQLNAQAFGHDRVTDVISYTLPQPDGSVLGDIYLCRSAAAQAAHRLGHATREEVLRLAIHGVLHVLGDDHPEGEERLTSPMWQRQEAYLREVLC